MAIKINDIPPEGLNIEVEDSFDLFDKGTLTPFTAKLAIKHGGPGIFRVTGTVSATPELECSRCLKSFPFPVRDAAMEFELVPAASVGGGAEHELGKGELDTEFYEGDEIEPRDLLREQVLLALPMVPVHSEECRGLCPVCGADRNEKACSCAVATMPEKESPFAALKKIIKPEKE